MMAKVEASKFVATMPGVAAYAAWLGCLPSRLMVVVPSVTYRGARHGCFCPSYVFADEACFLDVSLESFAYKDEMKSDWFSDPTSFGGSIPLWGSSSFDNLWFLVLEVVESSMSGDALVYGQLLQPVRSASTTHIGRRLKAMFLHQRGSRLQDVFSDRRLGGRLGAYKD